MDDAAVVPLEGKTAGDELVSTAPTKRARTDWTAETWFQAALTMPIGKFNAHVEAVKTIVNAQTSLSQKLLVAGVISRVLVNITEDDTLKWLYMLFGVGDDAAATPDADAKFIRDSVDAIRNDGPTPLRMAIMIRGLVAIARVMISAGMLYYNDVAWGIREASYSFYVRALNVDKTLAVDDMRDMYAALRWMTNALTLAYATNIFFHDAAFDGPQDTADPRDPRLLLVAITRLFVSRVAALAHKRLLDALSRPAQPSPFHVVADAVGNFLHLATDLDYLMERIMRIRCFRVPPGDDRAQIEHFAAKRREGNLFYTKSLVNMLGIFAQRAWSVYWSPTDADRLFFLPDRESGKYHAFFARGHVGGNPFPSFIAYRDPATDARPRLRPDVGDSGFFPPVPLAEMVQQYQWECHVVHVVADDDIAKRCQSHIGSVDTSESGLAITLGVRVEHLESLGIAAFSEAFRKSGAANDAHRFDNRVAVVTHRAAGILTEEAVEQIRSSSALTPDDWDAVAAHVQEVLANLERREIYILDVTLNMFAVTASGKIGFYPYAALSQTRHWERGTPYRQFAWQKVIACLSPLATERAQAWIDATDGQVIGLGQTAFSAAYKLMRDITSIAPNDFDTEDGDAAGGYVYAVRASTSAPRVTFTAHTALSGDALKAAMNLLGYMNNMFSLRTSFCVEMPATSSIHTFANRDGFEKDVAFDGWENRAATIEVIENEMASRDDQPAFVASKVLVVRQTLPDGAIPPPLTTLKWQKRLFGAAAHVLIACAVHNVVPRRLAIKDFAVVTGFPAENPLDAVYHYAGIYQLREFIPNADALRDELTLRDDTILPPNVPPVQPLQVKGRPISHVADVAARLPVETALLYQSLAVTPSDAHVPGVAQAFTMAHILVQDFLAAVNTGERLQRATTEVLLLLALQCAVYIRERTEAKYDDEEVHNTSLPMTGVQLEKNQDAKEAAAMSILYDESSPFDELHPWVTFMSTTPMDNSILAAESTQNLRRLFASQTKTEKSRVALEEHGLKFVVDQLRELTDSPSVPTCDSMNPAWDIRLLAERIFDTARDAMYGPSMGDIAANEYRTAFVQFVTQDGGGGTTAAYEGNPLMQFLKTVHDGYVEYYTKKHVASLVAQFWRNVVHPDSIAKPLVPPRAEAKPRSTDGKSEKLEALMRPEFTRDVNYDCFLAAYASPLVEALLTRKSPVSKQLLKQYFEELSGQMANLFPDNVADERKRAISVFLRHACFMSHPDAASALLDKLANAHNELVYANIIERLIYALWNNATRQVCLSYQPFVTNGIQEQLNETVGGRSDHITNALGIAMVLGFAPTAVSDSTVMRIAQINARALAIASDDAAQRGEQKSIMIDKEKEVDSFERSMHEKIGVATELVYDRLNSLRGTALGIYDMPYSDYERLNKGRLFTDRDGTGKVPALHHLSRFVLDPTIRTRAGMATDSRRAIEDDRRYACAATVFPFSQIVAQDPLVRVLRGLAYRATPAEAVIVLLESDPVPPLPRVTPDPDRLRAATVQLARVAAQVVGKFGTDDGDDAKRKAATVTPVTPAGHGGGGGFIENEERDESSASADVQEPSSSPGAEPASAASSPLINPDDPVTPEFAEGYLFAAAIIKYPNACYPYGTEFFRLGMLAGTIDHSDGNKRAAYATDAWRKTNTSAIGATRELTGQLILRARMLRLAVDVAAQAGVGGTTLRVLAKSALKKLVVAYANADRVLFAKMQRPERLYESFFTTYHIDSVPLNSATVDNALAARGERLSAKRREVRTTAMTLSSHLDERIRVDKYKVKKLPKANK